MQDRTKFIGASEAGKLMTGTPEEIHELWLIKSHQIPEPDLSDPKQCDNWFQVGLGNVTEEYHLAALKRIHTNIDVHPANGKTVAYSDDRIRATPDAYFSKAKQEVIDGVLDAKHTNSFSKPEQLYGRYYWQMQQQMLCCDLEHALISPIYGNKLGDLIQVEACYPDQMILVDRIQKFWEFVDNKQPPEFDTNETPAPRMPTAYRQIDLTDTNFGPDIELLAPTWIEKKAAKKEWEKVDKHIKGFMPEDVNEATGYGIKITRSKPSKSRPNGSVTIQAA